LKEEDVYPYYGFLDDSIEIKSLFPQASKIQVHQQYILRNLPGICRKGLQ
jgi:hypothetical protein